MGLIRRVRTYRDQIAGIRALDAAQARARAIASHAAALEGALRDRDEQLAATAADVASAAALRGRVATLEEGVARLGEALRLAQAAVLDRDALIASLRSGVDSETEYWRREAEDARRKAETARRAAAAVDERLARLEGRPPQPSASDRYLPDAAAAVAAERWATRTGSHRTAARQVLSTLTNPVTAAQLSAAGIDPAGHVAAGLVDGDVR